MQLRKGTIFYLPLKTIELAILLIILRIKAQFKIKVYKHKKTLIQKAEKQITK